MALTSAQLAANRQRLLTTQANNTSANAGQRSAAQTALNAQTPAVTPVNPLANKNTGVYTNKTTGVQTDKYGNPLGGTSTAADSSTAVSSYEDVGKALLQSQYDTTAQTAKDYGLGDTYSSFGQYVQDQVQAQKEQAALQTQQLNEQDIQNGYQTGQSVNQLQSQTDVAQSQLAGSREGTQSLTNSATSQALGKATNEQIARLQASQAVAHAGIEQAKTDLKRAQMAGNTALAQKIQGTLDAATFQAKQIDTEYIAALTNQSQEERAVQAQKNANLTTFTSFVDNGEVLSTNAISSMAASLGVPFEVANSYYEGAAQVRDNKTLDAQTKQVQLDQLKQDLNDQITGADTAASKAIKGLQTLRASGASEDVIAAYKNAAGITDYNDPLTKAKLAMDQADLKIKQDQANGILTSPIDQMNFAKLQYEYYQQAGITPGSIPSGGSDETTAVQSGNGIVFNFKNNTKISSGSRALSQCGQFVNDVLGLSMGDSYASKMAYVDKNIKVPEAGMAFVEPVSGDYAPNGHTGIVESYDPTTGMVNVADVNSDGKGTAKHHQISLGSILNGGGFVPGSGESLTGGTQTSPEATAVSDGLSALAGSISTKFQYESVSKTVNDYLKNGEVQKAKDFILTTAPKSLDATAYQDFRGAQLTQELLTNIEPDLAALGGDTGFLSGTFEQSMQKIGQTTDPAKAAVQKKILYAMQRYRKGITGAGFAEAETAEYGKLFPSIGNSTDLNQATLDSLKESLGITVDSYYGQVLGQDVYDQLSGKGTAQNDEWSTFTPISEQLDALN